MGYIRDGFNPRGAEYGATARAAQAAENTQQAMEDMLELAAAPDENARRAIAQQIRARRQRQAVNVGRGRVAKYTILALIAAFCIGVYQLGDDSSALSAAYRAFMATPSSQVPDASPAPTRAVRALDAQDSDAPEDVVARGEQVLRDSGMSNEQINAR